MNFRSEFLSGLIQKGGSGRPAVAISRPKGVIDEATNTFYFLYADTRAASALAKGYVGELYANAHTKSPGCATSKRVSANIIGPRP